MGKSYAQQRCWVFLNSDRNTACDFLRLTLPIPLVILNRALQIVINMKMQIGGKAVEACSHEFSDIINPATGELIDRVPRGTEEDAEMAVEAAWSAFSDWASTSPQQRAGILYRAAGIVRERKDELAVLLTREQGKPLTEAKNEIEGFANVLEYYCGLRAVSTEILSRSTKADMLLP